MKNSRQHAQRLRKLYRTLKRVHSKVEPVSHDDPVDALIYGVISEKRSAPAAEAALKGIRRTFINWNDLRVSRVEEIAEVLGGDGAAGRDTAALLTAALRAIFDMYHMVSLEPLKKLGKRPAKQAIEKLAGVSRFAVDYCMLTSLEAHAIPLTDRMLEYLKRHKIVDAHASEDEIEGFLARQVSAKSAYEFYALLRQECECPRITEKDVRKTRRPPTRKAAKAKTK
jgi:endonuclease III